MHWKSLPLVLILVTACSTSSRSSTCGRGVEGASCTATEDCECGLHCFEGTCVVGAEGTGTAPDEDATTGDLPTPGPGADIDSDDTLATVDGDDVEETDADDVEETDGEDVAPDADDQDADGVEEEVDADGDDVPDADGTDVDEDAGRASPSTP